MKVVLLVHVATTLFMVGAIWVIQLVHYKLFNQVGSEAFVNYQQTHTLLITPVVGIPMLIEALTALLLVLDRPFNRTWWLAMIGLILVGVVWLSTMFIQVPLHNRLGIGFDENTYQALVTSNWIRTIAWTIRGVLVLALVAEAISTSQ